MSMVKRRGSMMRGEREKGREEREKEGRKEREVRGNIGHLGFWGDGAIFVVSRQRDAKAADSKHSESQDQGSGVLGAHDLAYRHAASIRLWEAFAMSRLGRHA
jgi:hypothetical protein